MTRWNIISAIAFNSKGGRRDSRGDRSSLDLGAGRRGWGVWVNVVNRDEGWYVMHWTWRQIEFIRETQPSKRGRYVDLLGSDLEHREIMSIHESSYFKVLCTARLWGSLAPHFFYINPKLASLFPYHSIIFWRNEMSIRNNNCAIMINLRSYSDSMIWSIGITPPLNKAGQVEHASSASLENTSQRHREGFLGV